MIAPVLVDISNFPAALPVVIECDTGSESGSVAATVPTVSVVAASSATVNEWVDVVNSGARLQASVVYGSGSDGSPESAT